MDEVIWLGRTAVVTGAASGIGLAMVRRFAAAGMRIAMADWDAATLNDAVAALRSEGAAVLAIPTDVRDPESVNALATAVAAEFGPVHLLCNNAGVIRPGRSWETSPDDWSEVMAVNVEGVVNGLRAFVPAMLAHGKPCHVVNTASGAGLSAAPSFSAYCVSKATVIALSEVFAAEVALVPDARLTVHVLCPGSATSNLFRDEARRRAHDGAQVGMDVTTQQRWEQASSATRTDQVGPDVIVDALWQALGSGEFYVLPMQAAMRDAGAARLVRLADALDRAAPLDAPGSTDPTSTNVGVLVDYFARVDGPTPASALELVADELRFAFSRPDGAIEGGREELAGYLGIRRALGHRIDHHATKGFVELAVGQSVDGDTELGAFLAAMRIDERGRIAEYMASFHPGRTFGER